MMFFCKRPVRTVFLRQSKPVILEEWEHARRGSIDSASRRQSGDIGRAGEAQLVSMRISGVVSGAQAPRSSTHFRPMDAAKGGPQPGAAPAIRSPSDQIHLAIFESKAANRVVVIEDFNIMSCYFDQEVRELKSPD
jgi:hypothetical protein